MQTLTVGKTTEDIEMLLIVSKRGTWKGVFPTINFEMKIFFLKFIKKSYFLPQNRQIDNWT